MRPKPMKPQVPCSCWVLEKHLREVRRATRGAALIVDEGDAAIDGIV